MDQVTIRCPHIESGKTLELSVLDDGSLVTHDLMAALHASAEFGEPRATRNVEVEVKRWP